MKLRDYLTRSKEIMDGATGKPWYKGRDDIDSYQMDGLQFARVYTGDRLAKRFEVAEIECKFHECHQNARAVVHSVNEHARLVRIIEIQAEALAKIAGHEYAKGYEMSDAAAQAVSDVEELLK